MLTVTIGLKVSKFLKSEQIEVQGVPKVTEPQTLIKIICQKQKI